MTARDVRPYLVLSVLTLASTFGYIDRAILNLLVQPIKASFGLSDVQISLLQGLGFSSGYLLLTPLFGRWVDVARGRVPLACATAAWSVATALCGTAQSFRGLLALRFGIGCAEAGLTPASWSIIGELFDTRKLAVAFGIFFLAPYLGAGFALLLGGGILAHAASWDVSGILLLKHAAPWQLVFLIIGSPGVVVALLILLVTRPERGMRAEAAPRSLPLAEVFGTMMRQKEFYGYFYFGMALIIIPLYAFPSWMPTLLTRRFGMPIAQVGSHWGAITLAAGCGGMLCGPTLGALLRRWGYRDASIRVPIVCAISLALCCVALHLSTSLNVALMVAGFAVFFNSAPLALAASALQTVTPERMRGMTASIYAIIAMVTGLAIAPTLVAILSDWVFRDEARVGDSLVIVCGAAAVLGAILLARCRGAFLRLSSQDSTDGMRTAVQPKY
jgi:MFS transporter, Spinster family, sphingosine-1-phosphate transporter